MSSAKRTFVSLLVGSHFHPPAKLLLEHLPGKTPLWLRKEPENPYDEHAIAVYLCPREAIPKEQYGMLAEALLEYGTDIQQLLATEFIQMGHVAASGGKPLRAAPEGFVGTIEFLGAPWPSDGPLAAHLGFTPDGKHTVWFEAEPLAPQELLEAQ